MNKSKVQGHSHSRSIPSTPIRKAVSSDNKKTKKGMTMKSICFTLAACIAACGVLSAQGADESKAPQADRMAWWREARYGMLVCWGIYAVPARGEWVMDLEHIPVAKYEAYAKEFNPVKFDARKWVGLAKDAGMKYLVFTAKHHDGFCMFNTQATDFNVVTGTPWRRDPLKDLSEECRRQGIKFCVYYSIMDWHHPDQMPTNDDPERPNYNDSRMRPGRKPSYIQYMKTQLKEMIDQYQPAVIWFDGQWGAEWTNADGNELYHWLLEQDPTLIISDRVKGAGDFGTPEQHVPATGLPGDWETCMTMSTKWGYVAEGNEYQAPETLLRTLVDIASKGGNFLLNVGPTAEGVIPAPEVDRLQMIGKWMKVNGEAIYGTTASPFPKIQPWGRCTKRIAGDRTLLYLLVLEWPKDGRLVLPALKNKVESAALLAGGAKLETTNGEEGVSIAVPSMAPDADCSVIKLTIQGGLELGPELAIQQADGSMVFDVFAARLSGALRLEPHHPKGNIGNWSDPKDSAEWRGKIMRPGIFTVSVEIGAPGDSAITLTLGDQKLDAKLARTGSYATFQKVEMGTVTIASPGIVTIKVSPAVEGWGPINLATVTLEPKL
jgi:alpha-L-fucosidase